MHNVFSLITKMQKLPEVNNSYYRFLNSNPTEELMLVGWEGVVVDGSGSMMKRGKGASGKLRSAFEISEIAKEDYPELKGNGGHPN